jgi:hypothetical protein
MHQSWPNEAQRVGCMIESPLRQSLHIPTPIRALPESGRFSNHTFSADLDILVVGKSSSRADFKAALESLAAVVTVHR